MMRSRFVRRSRLVPVNQSLVPAVRAFLQYPYDWIIVTDDQTLKELLDSDLSLDEKLRVLPVLKQENFSHIYSKIGFSKVLSAAGISTPPFSVARSKDEASRLAHQLGFPVLIKQDSSGGGAGVYECLYRS